MPLAEKIIYIHEPTPLQCGQAVLAMLSGKSVSEIVGMVGPDRETSLKDMFRALEQLGIGYEAERIPVVKKSELPPVCILSLETPRCWHWSLYFMGVFYDPEHGVMEDFPESGRRYYWKIDAERKNKP